MAVKLNSLGRHTAKVPVGLCDCTYPQRLQQPASLRIKYVERLSQV